MSVVSQTLTFAEHIANLLASRMALENLLSHVGITKHLTDRHSGEYVTPVHDQHIYYSYEPSQPSYGHASSKHYGGSGLKSNASMSALTLLAFLFFLHILQQCIKEHMNEMSAAPVVVMSSSREGNDVLQKTVKIDKSGDTPLNTEKKSPITYDKKNPFESVEVDKMMKINAPEHKPRVDKVYTREYDESEKDGSSFSGYVSAMNE